MAGTPSGNTPLGDAFARADLIAAEAIDRIDELSDFEADFVSQLAARLGKYGKRTLMSDKQREVVDGLAKKLELEAVPW